MASASGGPPDGPLGNRFPSFMDPNKEFGRIIVLQMTGASGHILPKNPFVIGESVEKAAGCVESAYSEAQGTKYTIKTRKQEQVNKLLALKHLLDGTNITITYHPTLNSCKCVISSFDLIELTEKEILEQLSNQNVSEVRRITRMQDKSKIKTPTLILTFRQTTYPEYVKVGLLRVPTRTYYPNPMLCYGCFEYGHSSKFCKGPKRCFNCSEEHQANEQEGSDNSTESTACENPQYCHNCKSEHRPGSRKCEIYQKEAKIVKTKIDMNITYAEARKRVETGQTSYAQVTAQNRMDSIKLGQLIKEDKRKDDLITKLIEREKQQAIQIEKLLSEIKNLRNDLNKRNETWQSQIKPMEKKAEHRSRSRTVNLDKCNQISQRSENKRNRELSQRRIATSNSPPLKKTTNIPDQDQESLDRLPYQNEMYASDTETSETPPLTSNGSSERKRK